MTPDNLDTLSDAELNECFAVEVAGWTSYDGRRLISPQPRRRIVIPPDFVFDANAVLPFLEKYWWMLSFAPKRPRDPVKDNERYNVRTRTADGVERNGYAPTFARAAAIALIRAKRKDTL